MSLRHLHSYVKEKGTLNFVVGTDGSDASRHAFDLASSLWKPHDHITILHVINPSKDQASLPYDMRAATIEEYYRTRCPSRFPASSWRFVNVIKASGHDTKDEVVAFLNDPSVDADLLVVGMVGRKGPKESPTLIGRTSDYSLREAHVSSCITKLGSIPDAAIFVCALDGSDRAHLGVELIEHLKRPTDRVILLHIEDPTTQSGAPQFRSETVATRYAAMCASKPDWTIARVLKSAGMTVAETIADFTIEKSVHMLVLGADGVSKHAQGQALALGSNSDILVKTVRCNVICMHAKGRSFEAFGFGSARSTDSKSGVESSTF